MYYGSGKGTRRLDAGTICRRESLIIPSWRFPRNFFAGRVVGSFLPAQRAGEALHPCYRQYPLLWRFEVVGTQRAGFKTGAGELEACGDFLVPRPSSGERTPTGDLSAPVRTNRSRQHCQRDVDTRPSWQLPGELRVGKIS